MRSDDGKICEVDADKRSDIPASQACRKRQVRLGALAGKVPASSIPDFSLPLTEEELRDWE
jgi:hypothetical protein